MTSPLFGTEERTPATQAVASVFTFAFLAILAALGVGTYLVFQFFLTPLLWAVLIGAILHPYKQDLSASLRKWLLGVEKKALTTAHGGDDKTDYHQSASHSFLLSILVLPFGLINFVSVWLLTFMWKNRKILVIGSATFALVGNRRVVRSIAQLWLTTFSGSFEVAAAHWEATLVSLEGVRIWLSLEVMVALVCSYLLLAVYAWHRKEALVLLSVSNYVMWTACLLVVLPYLHEGLGAKLLLICTFGWWSACLYGFLRKTARDVLRRQKENRLARRRLRTEREGKRFSEGEESEGFWTALLRIVFDDESKKEGDILSEDTPESLQVVDASPRRTRASRMNSDDLLLGYIEPFNTPTIQAEANERKRKSKLKKKTKAKKGSYFKVKHGGGMHHLASSSKESRTESEKGSADSTPAHNSISAAAASLQTLSQQLRMSSRPFFVALFFCVALQIFSTVILGLIAWALGYKLLRLLFAEIHRRLDQQLAVAGTVAQDSYTWIMVNLVPGPVRLSLRILRAVDRRLGQTVAAYLDSITSLLTILAIVLLFLFFIVFLAIQLHAESLTIASGAREIWRENVVDNLELWTSLRLMFGLSEEELKRVLSVGFDRVVDSAGESLMELARSMLGSNIDLSLLVQNQAKMGAFAAPFLRFSSNSSSLSNSVNFEQEWEFLKSNITHFFWTGELPPFLLPMQLSSLFSLRQLFEIAQSNISLLSGVGKAVWEFVQNNASSAVQAILWTLTSIIYASQSIVNFAFTVVLFFTALYYLLDTEGEEYKPLQFVSSMIPFGDIDAVRLRLRKTIQRVFESNLKMSLFYGFYYWLIFNLFDFSVVVLPALVPALMSVVPLLVVESVAVPGILHLWLLRGDKLDTILFVFFAFLPRFYVVSVIYGEIESSHHYITGLAVLGGLYLFGVEGVLLGPLLVCVLFLAVEYYRDNFALSSAMDQRRPVIRDDVGEGTMYALRKSVETGLSQVAQQTNSLYGRYPVPSRQTAPQRLLRSNSLRELHGASRRRQRHEDELLKLSSIGLSDDTSEGEGSTTTLECKPKRVSVGSQWPSFYSRVSNFVSRPPSPRRPPSPTFEGTIAEEERALLEKDLITTFSDEGA